MFPDLMKILSLTSCQAHCKRGLSNLTCLQPCLGSTDSYQFFVVVFFYLDVLSMSQICQKPELQFVCVFKKYFFKCSVNVS